MGEHLASHRFDDGGRVVLRRKKRWFTLAHAVGEVSQTIEFDRARRAEGEIVLSKRTAESRHVQTGTLAGTYSDYGAVGAALHQLADGMES